MASTKRKCSTGKLGLGYDVYTSNGIYRIKGPGVDVKQPDCPWCTAILLNVAYEYGSKRKRRLK